MRLTAITALVTRAEKIQELSRATKSETAVICTDYFASARDCQLTANQALRSLLDRKSTFEHRNVDATSRSALGDFVDDPVFVPCWT